MALRLRREIKKPPRSGAVIQRIARQILPQVVSFVVLGFAMGFDLAVLALWFAVGFDLIVLMLRFAVDFDLVVLVLVVVLMFLDCFVLVVMFLSRLMFI